MRAITSTAFAVLVTAMTSAVAIAQTRPAMPPHRTRSAQPSNRDSQPPRPGTRRQVPMGQEFGPRDGGPVGSLLRMRQRLALTDDQVARPSLLPTLRAVAGKSIGTAVTGVRGVRQRAPNECSKGSKESA